MCVDAHAHTFNQKNRPRFNPLDCYPTCAQQASLLLLWSSTWAFVSCLCLTWYPPIHFFEAWSELHNGSGPTTFRLIPSSSTILCASFTSQADLFSHDYNLIPSLILISLYSRYMYLTPRPLPLLEDTLPLCSWGRVFPSFSLINFPVSLSMSRSSHRVSLCCCYS